MKLTAMTFAAVLFNIAPLAAQEAGSVHPVRQVCRMLWPPDGRGKRYARASMRMLISAFCSAHCLQMAVMSGILIRQFSAMC